MSVGPLNLPITVLFALIFALLGVVLLLSFIYSGMRPDEQIALANVEKLASAIDEACFLGKSNYEKTVIKDFYLPQNKPTASGLSSFAPTIRIRTDGDPKFLLYYEMFPPGEASSWELYHDFSYRAVVMMPDGSVPDVDSLPDLIQSAKGFVFETYMLDEDPPTEVDVVIGNMVFSGDIDPTTGNELSAGLSTRTFGSWEYVGDKEMFTVDSAVLADSFNKTVPKYLSCGPYSLCFKIKERVYSYELKYCKARGIDYMVLADVGSSFGFSPLNMKKFSDFYLTSPCDTKIEITIWDDCNFENWETCGSYAKYPVYGYCSGSGSLFDIPCGNNDFVVVDSHTACVEDLDRKTDTPNDPNKLNVPCIVVEVTDRGDFCYTKEESCSKAGLLPADCIHPIRRLTDYHSVDLLGDGIKYDVFVLKHAEPKMIESWLTVAAESLPFFKSSIWRWPM